MEYFHGANGNHDHNSFSFVGMDEVLGGLLNESAGTSDYDMMHAEPFEEDGEDIHGGFDDLESLGSSASNSSWDDRSFVTDEQGPQGSNEWWQPFTTPYAALSRNRAAPVPLSRMSLPLPPSLPGPCPPGSRGQAVLPLRLGAAAVRYVVGYMCANSTHDYSIIDKALTAFFSPIRQVEEAEAAASLEEEKESGEEPADDSHVLHVDEGTMVSNHDHAKVQQALADTYRSALIKQYNPYLPKIFLTMSPNDDEHGEKEGGDFEIFQEEILMLQDFEDSDDDKTAILRIDSIDECCQFYKSLSLSDSKPLDHGDIPPRADEEDAFFEVPSNFWD
jgi:hypothetical protein